MAYTPTNTQWIKVTKSYTDFATAGLTNDIEIYSLPAKTILQQIVIKHNTSFTGGLIATYTISVGIVGNLVKYVAASNVFQATGNTVFFPTAITTPLSATPENFGVVTSIRASAISTVGLLNEASAGSVDFYLLVSQLP